MATVFDQHYLAPVSSQQPLGPSRRWYSTIPQEPNTNGNGHTLPNMPPSTQSSTDSQPSIPPVEPSMDTDVAAPQASPARGGRGGRARGRGGRPPAKSKAKAPKVTKAAANVKQGPGRGRRQKVYDFIKAQAAHERMSELKSNFTQLTRLMKPALNELADRTLAKLNNNPKAHEEVPEAHTVHKFLDQRLDETIKSLGLRMGTQVAHATKMHDINTNLAREECTEKILEAECEMLDSLLAKCDRLEYLHDNQLPVDLPDVSYEYQEITQQQVDQQGPYVHYDESGVCVPAPERIGVPLSQLMNESYQFPDEHRGKRKAVGEPEGQPDAKRQGLLGLDDDIPRRTSALMSANDDVAESRSATPGEGEQPEPAAKPTRAARGKAPKPIWTTTDGTVVEEKDEQLLDVEEVNGLPLPKGASLPDEHGVRTITKSRKVEYANNRIMAPVAVPFEDWQIGYRDSSNNPLKGATRARRKEYLGQPNSNAAYYDRRVANYNSVLQTAADYDQDLVKKHNLHPTLGLFMPNSVNIQEYPVEKDLQQYKPVVQVGPRGQIFHSSRSVPRHRLDLEAKKLEKRERLKSSVAGFLRRDNIPEEEVAPPKQIVQRHREDVLIARAIDPDTLPVPAEMPPSPESDVEQQEEVAIEAAVEHLRGIAELLNAADFVASEENAAKMVSNTNAHKSSRPYDAIRDVFTENAPVAAPAPATPAQPPTGNTFNLSLLAEVAEEAERAEKTLKDEELQRAELQRAELEEVELARQEGIRMDAQIAERERQDLERQQIERQEAERAEFERQEYQRQELERQQAQRAEYPPPPPPHVAGPVESSVMDPRVFPHDAPRNNMQMASAEPPQSQYQEPPPSQYQEPPPVSQYPEPPIYHAYDSAPQWHREGPVQPAEPTRGNDFLRTALNPQSPPPNYSSSYLPPQDYQFHHAHPTQVPDQPQGGPFNNAASHRGNLPALRPVRTSEDGTVAPDYQGSPAQSQHPSMMVSNNSYNYPPPPPRPYHNGYAVDEQQMYQHQQPGPSPARQLQPLQPMLAPAPPSFPPQSPDHGYTYPPLAPQPGAVVYQPAGPYNPIAPHPMTPASLAQRGPPGSSSRPYRKLEPAPAQAANKPRPGAQRPELRTVQFDYREGIKDYTPLEAPPSHGPSAIRGWSHQNLNKQPRRVSKDAAPAPTDEPS